MDGELFVEWFRKVFIPNCGTGRPVILIMDNHDSHISLPVIRLARENDIILLGLPAHTTHILQPLDVKVRLHNYVLTLFSTLNVFEIVVLRFTLPLKNK